MTLERLDLGYPDPPLAASFVADVLHRSRALRRRRTALTVGAACVVVAGVFSVVIAPRGHRADDSATVAAAGDPTFLEALAGLDAKARLAATAPRVVQTTSTGEQTVIWLSLDPSIDSRRAAGRPATAATTGPPAVPQSTGRSRPPAPQTSVSSTRVMFCVGTRPRSTAVASPSFCAPVDSPRTVGFIRNITMGIDAEPTHSHAPFSLLVAGVVKGNVTSVRLSSPDRAPWNAHVEKVDPLGTVGTLYWSLLPGITDTTMHVDRTAMDGAQRLDSCLGSDCDGEDI